jgi:hypothetical protein
MRLLRPREVLRCGPAGRTSVEPGLLFAEGYESTEPDRPSLPVTVSGLMLRPANEIAVSHLPEAEYSTNPPDILRHKSCGIKHMAGNMQEL